MTIMQINDWQIQIHICEVWDLIPIKHLNHILNNIQIVILLLRASSKVKRWKIIL